MEKTAKKKMGFFDVVGKLLKSKPVRRTLLVVILILATFTMFLMDEGNYIRNNYLKFLNANFIADLMVLIGIGRYNISVSAWSLFLCGELIILLCLFGSIFSKFFVTNKAEKNVKSFKSLKSAKAFYAFVFYAVLVLIGALIILGAYLFGAFDKFDKYSSNVFMNLLITIAFFLGFLLALLIIAFIIYLFISLIIWACKGGKTKAVAKVAEEQPVEAVAEETKAEVAETPVAEEVAETPAAEAPVAAEPAATAVVAPAKENAAENGLAFTKRSHISKSFQGKMCQVKEEEKGYYSELKNYILSFNKARSLMSWNYENFFYGRNSAVKLAVRGKTLVMFVALNPADYVKTKYYAKDMSKVRKFDNTPTMVRVKSARGVKFAKELVAKVFEGVPAKKGFAPQEYKFKYQSDRQLVEHNLAKQK